MNTQDTPEPKPEKLTVNVLAQSMWRAEEIERLQARVAELERLVAANATKNISLIGDKQLLQARVAELEAETRELTAYIRENEHMD